jgi:hypothetical protein
MALLNRSPKPRSKSPAKVPSRQVAPEELLGLEPQEAVKVLSRVLNSSAKKLIDSYKKLRVMDQDIARAELSVLIGDGVLSRSLSEGTEDDVYSAQRRLNNMIKDAMRDKYKQLIDNQVRILKKHPSVYPVVEPDLTFDDFRKKLYSTSLSAMMTNVKYHMDDDKKVIPEYVDNDKELIELFHLWDKMPFRD